MERTMPDVIFEPFIYDGRKLSLEEANAFLRYGWLDKYEDAEDPRLRSGEFLFVFDRKTGYSYQISSTAYQWRKTIHGNNFTNKKNLYHLLNDANFFGKTVQTLTEEMGIFLEKYPLMCSLDFLSLRQAIIDQGLPLYSWPSGEFSLDLKSRKYRQILIWQAFFISVPVSQQKEVWPLLSDYWKDQETLIDWMMKNSKLSPEEREKLSPYTQEALKGLDAITAAHPGDLERSVKLIVKNLSGERLLNIVACLEDPSLVSIQKARGLNAKNKKQNFVSQ